MSWDINRISKQVEDLTIKLVNVKSVNGTQGEVEIAETIESILRDIPYFQSNSNHVWTKEVDNDPLKRRSVFAYLESETPSNRTILLHAHSDTVTIEDFGSLQDFANKPHELKEKLKEINLSEDVKNDLDSDDWMFGRGALDMKSGMAAHLSVLTYLSENRDQFSGNILFMANPIEETTHGGIIDALPELERVKKESNLDYICALNTDFVGPLYKGDENRYIYLGSVGKLLPSFYIRGSETHVGQPYEGLDPNMIASELVNRINLNVELADEYNGEFSQPPVTLKMKDLKPTYNVQTPIASFVYFNYYVHQITPDKIMEQLKAIALESFNATVKKMNDNYALYCEKTNHTYSEIDWQPRVMIYEELYEHVKSLKGDIVDERLNDVLENSSDAMDPREVGRLMVEVLLELDTDQSPVIILFYATPYVPRNYLSGADENGPELLTKLNSTLDEIAEETDNTFVVNKFFPSLTDSSYLSLEDTDEEIHYLKNNFPGMDTLYPVSIDTIRRLDIPALNFGSWGKDAHKMTERVYKPYTFKTLPTLIYNFCKKVLND